MPACSSPPIAAVAHRLTAPAALAPDQCRSLLDHLAHIADPRHRRGRRHALGTVLAVAVAAVLTGAKSLAVLGQTDVDHTTNEIARFRPLLEGLDLAGWVVTADAFIPMSA